MTDSGYPPRKMIGFDLPDDKLKQVLTDIINVILKDKGG